MALQTPNVLSVLYRMTTKQHNGIKNFISGSSKQSIKLFKLYQKYEDEESVKTEYKKGGSSKSSRVSDGSFFTNKSNLKKNVEHALMIQHIEKNEYQKGLALLNVWSELQDNECCLSYAHSLYKAMKKQLDRNELCDYETFAQLCYFIYYHPSSTRYWQQSTPTIERPNFFQEGRQSEQKEIILRSLRNFTEQQARARLFEEVVENELISLDHLVEIAKKYNIPLFHLYVDLFSLSRQLTVANEFLSVEKLRDYWQSLRSAIKNSFGNQPTAALTRFDASMLASKLGQLISYSYKNCQVTLSGQPDETSIYQEYAKLYIEIQQFLEQHNLLLYQNKLSLANYITTAMYSWVAEKVEFFEQFTTNYLDHIPKEYQEAANHLVAAYRTIREQQYDKALDHLTSIPHQGDKHLGIVSRLLKIQLYYYIHDDATLDYRLDQYMNSIKDYVNQRSELTLEQYQSIRNFIDHTSRLINLVRQYEVLPHDKKELIDSVLKENLLQGRYWLLLEIHKVKTGRQ